MLCAYQAASPPLALPIRHTKVRICCTSCNFFCKNYLTTTKGSAMSTLKVYWRLFIKSRKKEWRSKVYTKSFW